jgi:hypothetical protein
MKRDYVDIIVHLSRFPLSTIIFWLSVSLAVVEGAMARIRWPFLDRSERVRGVATTLVLVLIAGLTLIDGARVDGQLANLYDQVRRDSHAITRSNAQLIEANRQLDALGTTSSRLERLSAATTTQISRTRAELGTVKSVSAATATQLSHTRGVVDAVEKTSATAAAQLSHTRNQVNAVGAQVSQFAANTSRQLKALQDSTRMIAAKAGLFHLTPATIQNLIGVL